MKKTKTPISENHIRPDRSKWYLTAEEEMQLEELLDAVERGEVPVTSVLSKEQLATRSKENIELDKNIRYVKDKSISLRISDDVLQVVKQKAKKQWLPYQTLIGSWIYQHAMEE